MSVSLRDRAPTLLMVLAIAIGGLAACQAATGATLPRTAAASQPALPAAPQDPAPARPVGPVDAPAPPPDLVAPPTLAPLTRRIQPDLLVHGPGVDAGVLQRVQGIVPAGESALLRQGQVVLSLADGPHPLLAAGVD